MLYRHVFDKISTEFGSIFYVFVDFADIPEFRGSATARNIRSPVNDRNVMVNFKPGEYIRKMFFSQ